jgi:hypothetical protein
MISNLYVHIGFLLRKDPILQKDRKMGTRKKMAKWGPFPLYSRHGQHEVPVRPLVVDEEENRWLLCRLFQRILELL